MKRKTLKLFSPYNILHFKVKNLFKDLSDKCASKKIYKKYYCKLEDSTPFYDDQIIDDMRIVAYTCILGDYDVLQIPLVQFDNLDYVLLTDKPDKYQKYNHIFKVVKLPEEIIKMGSIYANRYVKLHPSHFFEGYDYSIYLDGNVRAIADIRQFVKLCSLRSGIAMHRHRERICIYKEAEVCLMLKRGDGNCLKAEMEHYKREGFPENFGMNEATIIATDLNNDISKKLLDEWWKEFVRAKSLRDQLAWPYVLWKNGFGIEDIGNLGSDIYKNSKVEMVRHK